MSDKIVFQKERLFGDIIGDTFEFIRQTYKEIGKALIFIAGPFIVLSGIAAGLYQSKVFGGMAELINKTNESPFDNIFGIEYLFIIIFSFIISILILLIACDGMILYMESGKENVTYENILKSLKKDFGFMIWTVIVSTFAIILGIVLFVIPGIYMAVALSIIPIVRIYERKGMYKSLRRTVQLIWGNWWKTLGIAIVFTMIIGIASMAFQIPNYILIFYTTMHSVGKEAGSVADLKIWFILAGVFSQLVFILNAIPVIGLSLFYFNLVEKKEGYSIEQRVNAIGEVDEE